MCTARTNPPSFPSFFSVFFPLNLQCSTIDFLPKKAIKKSVWAIVKKSYFQRNCPSPLSPFSSLVSALALQDCQQICHQILWASLWILFPRYLHCWTIALLKKFIPIFFFAPLDNCTLRWVWFSLILCLDNSGLLYLGVILCNWGQLYSLDNLILGWFNTRTI